MIIHDHGVERGYSSSADCLSLCLFWLIIPRPYRVGYDKPSVCPMLDSKESRMEWLSKLKIARKKAHDMVTYDLI